MCVFHIFLFTPDCLCLRSQHFVCVCVRFCVGKVMCLCLVLCVCVGVALCLCVFHLGGQPIH